jgi:hypothetical protein
MYVQVPNPRARRQPLGDDITDDLSSLSDDITGETGVPALWVGVGALALVYFLKAGLSSTHQKARKKYRKVSKALARM